MGPATKLLLSHPTHVFLARCASMYTHFESLFRTLQHILSIVEWVSFLCCGSMGPIAASYTCHIPAGNRQHLLEQISRQLCKLEYLDRLHSSCNGISSLVRRTIVTHTHTVLISIGPAYMYVICNGTEISHCVQLASTAPQITFINVHLPLR